MPNKVTLKEEQNRLSLYFVGELTLYTLSKLQKVTDKIVFKKISFLLINLEEVTFIDTAAALYILNLQKKSETHNVETELFCHDARVLSTIELVKHQMSLMDSSEEPKRVKVSILKQLTHFMVANLLAFNNFMEFFGKLIVIAVLYIKSFKNIRYKEIAFEINESAIKAIGIVALTSFLIGLVVAYQSAYQLKLYGANIFIVDMLGISILRELAPLMSAIVIAGRSGSAFTAQIGAMKITQELDAMKTMGFDPYAFLVLPKVIALMIAMPLLIFVADIMGMLGGMIVSHIDLGISVDLFLDRFNEVVKAKHFFIGLAKGPFFAFLIASIGIYRGLMVKDDTQSIGFNTTKSVVESLFAVIVCDALFSIAFTNLGM